MPPTAGALRALLLCLAFATAVAEALPRRLDCPWMLAHASDVELAEAGDDDLESISRALFAPLPPATLLERYRKEPTNALWSSEANPFGAFVRRGSGEPARVADLPPEIATRLQTAVVSELRGLERRLSKDPTEARHQIALAVLKAEDRLARELATEYRKLRKKRDLGDASVEAAQVEAARQIALRVAWDAFEKYLSATNAAAERQGRQIVEPRTFGEMASAALRAFTTYCELDGVRFSALKMEGSKEGEGYLAIRFHPDPERPIGRLAQAMEAETAGKASVWFAPHFFRESTDRNAEFHHTDSRGNRYLVVAPEFFHTGLSPEGRRTIVGRMKMTLAAEKTRSPIDVTIRPYRLVRGENVFGEQAATDQLLGAYDTLRRMGPHTGIELEPRLVAGMVGALARPLHRYMVEANESAKQIQGVLEWLFRAPIAERTVRVSRFGNHAGRENEYGWSIGVNDGRGAYVGELRLGSMEGRPLISWMGTNRVTAMPLKDPVLTAHANRLRELLRAEARSTPVDASPEARDVMRVTLMAVARQTELSMWMLEEPFDAVRVAAEATREYLASPSPGTEARLLEAVAALPEISTARVTTRGQPTAAASAPLPPAPDAPVVVSPYLMARWREAANGEKNDALARIGTYVVADWAYRNGYAVYDRSPDNQGYDLMLLNARTGDRFYVEVKARSAEADSQAVTFTPKELEFAMANPDRSGVGIVTVNADGTARVTMQQLRLTPFPPAR